MEVLWRSALHRLAHHRPSLVVAVLLVALASSQRAEAAQPPPKQGARWTGDLTSTTAASDLTFYKDVKVLVTFTQGNQSFQTYAFSRGNKKFSFRAAFPTQGTWTWSSQCITPTTICNGNSGLNASGSVMVDPPDSTNKLYSKGMIQPYQTSSPPTRIYFKYGATNEIFPWLGDTAWSAPIRAEPAQWTTYIQRLSTAGFTVVQIATPVDYMDGTSGEQPETQAIPPNIPALKPFSCPSPEPNQIPNVLCSMNNAYWNRFDDMVKEANDKGIVVVVVGLMERVVEDHNPYPDLDATKTFARTLASRLAGSHVIFSPAFDRSPHSKDDKTCCPPAPNPCPQSPTTCMEQRIDAIGAEILDATHTGKLATPPVSIRQLITNHSAGSDSPSDLLKFKDKSWLSFYLFQSGQAANLAADAGGPPLQAQHRLIFERAATFPPALAAKANVNAELIYEGVQAPCALCPGPCQQCPVTCALCPATCALCPPVPCAPCKIPCTECPGHPCHKCFDQATYGVYYSADSQRKGLWMSFFNGAAGGTIGVGGTFDWQGTGLTSSNSQSWIAVKRLKAFLDLTDWKALRPSPSDTQPRLQPQTLPAWQKIYAIENSGRTEVAVYFPERVAASVRVKDLPSRTACWFNPRNNNNQTATPQGTCQPSDSNPYCTYNPPAGGDWVLLFRQAACSASAGSLSVTSGTVALTEDDTGWALFSQRLDAQGEPFGEAVQITDAQIGASPKKTRFLEGPGDVNLVTWESEDPVKGTPSRIMAHLLDTKGSPIGEMIKVGTAAEGRATDPAIAVTPGGDYVVAWSILSDKGSEVHVQTLDSKGLLGEDLTIAVLPPESEPVEPMVSADAEGNVAVAWTEVAKTGASIGVRRLEATGKPAGTVAYPILQSKDTFESLSSVELSGGVLILTWEVHDSEGVTQGMFSRGFDAAGEPTGDVLTVWDPHGAGES